MLRLVFTVLLFGAAGCNLFEPAETVPSADVGSEADMAGSNDVGVSTDASDDDPDQPDMASCTPETPEQICARLGHECGAVQAVDLCGFDRAISCGGCELPEQCGAITPNACDCVAEDDVTFCQRQGRDCESVTGTDNCGAARTADCGMCDADEVCGEQTPNVCGCPCLVDGICRPDGSANPENSCEVCDPAVSTTAWTVDTGATCDDGNLCTQATTCSAQGSCVGTAVDCSGLTTDCRAGACDPSAGCFAVDLSDGLGCTSDGDDCTVDVCTAGNCTHDVAMGKCVIGASCFDDGAVNPANPCQACDVGTSVSAWTPTSGGGCADGDGLSCTSGTCSSGSCVAATDPGFCVIANTCVSVGTPNPADDCEVCAPAVSRTAWSPATDGTSCVSGTGLCNIGSCQGGTCTGTSGAGCDIAMACWPEGVLNPANDCEYCDPANDATDWSSLPAGTTCADDDDFHCTFGACDGGGTCDLAFDPDFCVEEDAEVCLRSGEGVGGLDCIACDPALGSVGPVANGTACQSEDALACTTGTCLDGWCSAVPDAGFCAIGGACYPDGAQDPSNVCAICDASSSQTEWSPNNGTACGTGLTCMDGECGASACGPPLPADRCLINGICYAAGEASPSSACEVCDPTTSQSAFSPPPGGLCDPGVQCASTGFCDAIAPGVCLAIPQTGWCVIEGVCYQEDDVNPAASCEVCAPETLPIAWWPRDGFCSVNGECASDGQARPGSACEICDADNPLTWSVRPSSCNIGGVCYNAGDPQPGNPCRICDPGKAQTQWSNALNSTVCGGNSCTCDNGVCDTSGGC